MKKEIGYPIRINVDGVRIPHLNLCKFSIIEDKDHKYEIPNALSVMRMGHSSGIKLRLLNEEHIDDVIMLPRVLSDLKELARVNKSIGMAVITLKLPTPIYIHYDLRSYDLLENISEAFKTDDKLLDTGDAVGCIIYNNGINDVKCDIYTIKDMIDRFKDPHIKLCIKNTMRSVDIKIEQLDNIESIAVDLLEQYLIDVESHLYNVIHNSPYKL